VLAVKNIGTTIFVIFVSPSRFATRFAKGVVNSINERLQARRERIIRNASQRLRSSAQAFRRHLDTYVRLRFTKSRKFTELEKKNHLVSLKSARVQRDAARLSAEECWDVLRRRGALPIDPATGKQWERFEDFLNRIAEVPSIAEEVCA